MENKIQNAEERFLNDEDYRENVLKKMRGISSIKLVDFLWELEDDN